MPLAALLLLSAAPAQLPPCHHYDDRGGVRAIVYEGDRKCVAFDAPRTFKGVWHNWFEGSRFVDDAGEPAPGARTWFGRDAQTRFPDGFRPKYGHAYRLTFVGRRATDTKPGKLDGYGHFGMSQSLVLADEILSVEDLGPMRREP